jgi:beta-N-acetylhexosaminidase
VDLEAVDEIVGIRAHTEVAREVAERSLTLVRDRAGLVPLPDSARVLVVSYAMPTDPVAGRTFRALLGAARPMDVARVDARTTPEEWDRLRVRADSFDLVLAAIHDAPPVSDDSVATDPGFPAFVDSLAAGGTPVLGVSFGSPYVLQAFPSLPTYLVAWSGVDVSQRAAARALLGEIPIAGRLPVSVPPDYEAGHGIRRKAAPNARAPSHSRGGPPDAAAPEAAPRRDER